MSKQVLYHQHGREPLTLEVVAEKDGVLDLAREAGGEAIITGIRLSDEALPGHATALHVVAAKEVKKEEPKKK